MPAIEAANDNRPRRRRASISTALAVALALGWAAREVAHARVKDAPMESKTVTLDKVKLEPASDQGKPVGQVGIYLAGDTPGSSKFVTGRFILDAGKTPHPPHVHVEEEVMIVESGTGVIEVDGKVTKVGPGSVMFTTPNVPHGIVNTGSTPIVFYFVKWAGKDAK